MDDQAPNYHREFFRSPHHAALGFLTLGLGFLSAALLPLIIGVTLYTLGWIYLPDLPFFRRWVDGKRDAIRRTEELEKVSGFVRRREALVESLAPERRARYRRLAGVCRDIEAAGAQDLLASSDPATDPRLRKIDELMWTFLRLLGIEESLERFLATEKSENVPALLAEAEEQAKRLTAEVDALKAKGSGADLEGRQRYLGSRVERLEVLRKRQQRTEQAQSNLALVVSEQERLEQQIKLIRADAVATKNAESLTARIDATVEHLDQTNKWLAEMDEFKDLVPDLPNTDLRVGYEANAAQAPPPIMPVENRTRQPLRQRQS
jgi:hypothetical protein